MRVVSLVPSSTETLLELGADVVACTRFCEQPAIRHVGGTKNPDVEAIVELSPDLVVLDREENRIEDHEALVDAGLRTFVSDVRSVADALAVVRALAAEIEVEVQNVAAAKIAAPAHADRRAFVPIWRRPWMTISEHTYGASVLAHAGVEVVAFGAGYPVVELDEVAAESPDLVLVPSEPYSFDAGHLDELRAALPNALVHRVDGQDLFWWGSRTPEAISRFRSSLAHLRSA